MAEQQRLGRPGLSIRVSSSIANFKTKLLNRTGLPEWNPWQLFRPVIFFGLYHWLDYLRFFVHFGTNKVVWCGGDVRNLQGSLWRYVLPHVEARHFCENKVEQKALLELGIESEVKPMIFDNPSKCQISFQHSDKPHVWMCAHPGREQEYGLELIELIAGQIPNVAFHVYGVKHPFSTILLTTFNIIYHGHVSEEQFAKEIKGYQASIRLNEFDGFSEATAKSILMGQYPITRIPYPNIAHYNSTEELIALLKELSDKYVPNPHSDYWRATLDLSLNDILNG